MEKEGKLAGGRAERVGVKGLGATEAYEAKEANMVAMEAEAMATVRAAAESKVTGCGAAAGAGVAMLAAADRMVEGEAVAVEEAASMVDAGGWVADSTAVALAAVAAVVVLVAGAARVAPRVLRCANRCAQGDSNGVR